MTSKASLSKKLIHKGLFHSDLKRFWWVSALYTIALVLMLPVYHLLQSTSEENTWAWDGLKAALNLTTGYSEFQIILTYLVPVFWQSCFLCICIPAGLQQLFTVFPQPENNFSLLTGELESCC